MSSAKTYPIEIQHFSVKLGARLLFDIDSFQPEPLTSTVITGATGSGKSVLLKVLSGLLPAGPFTIDGNIKLHGFQAYRDGLKTDFETWRQIRHAGITFVPAETAQAMNPALSLEQNLRVIAPEEQALVEDRLAKYFSLDFRKYARLYPDEVSGGELQRITLMILLSRRADLVFLDEPTVNLDRQLRKRFLEFLNSEILGHNGKTVLMASHDLDFVRGLKLDTIIALENGRLNTVAQLPENATHQKDTAETTAAAGLDLRNVSQSYKVRSVLGERNFQAFKGLNIDFKPGHIYGITGPSGCGKTSMIKAILRLLDSTSGTINLGGQNLVALKPRETGRDPEEFKPFRKKIAIVQQDSRYSFFPDLKIRHSLKEIHQVLDNSTMLDLDPVLALMKKIKLPLTLLDCLPRSLSSGEMKRMDIVRVLAARPEVILLDEPFAHIDFETRSTVMQAIADYLTETKAILIVVTHEDFDLKYFIQTDYDFLSMVEPKDQAIGA